MAADNGQMSFRRGVMSLVILGLLKKEDMYGYQLVQETERRSGGRIVTQEGSLYPVLYKLVDQGLISDRKVLVGRRLTRVYYHLEPAGEQRLEELVREYEEVKDWLPCSGKLKREIMARIKNVLDDYLAEHPDADFVELSHRFGLPKQIASSYVE